MRHTPPAHGAGIVIMGCLALAGCSDSDPAPSSVAPPAAAAASADRSRDFDTPPVVLPPLDAQEHRLGDHESGDTRIKGFQYGPIAAVDPPTAVADRLAGGRPMAGFIAIRTTADMSDGVVRAWIGGEDAAGTVRTKLFYRTQDRMYSGRALGPAALDDDARWWVELESADGERRRFAFELAR